LQGDLPFLQKPYMPGQLLEQVARVLERDRSPVVLIVDDDEDILYQLRASVRDAGYRVLEAADGQQAMTYIRTHPVKLVITDLFMPEKDGLELIGELRQGHPDIKILALSGAHHGTFLKLASSLGADVVLPKPFLNEQVTQVAESLMA
jgi:CheY-like chemotaxis protein